jgi:hypothetical protein
MKCAVRPSRNRQTLFTAAEFIQLWGRMPANEKARLLAAEKLWGKTFRATTKKWACVMVVGAK